MGGEDEPEPIQIGRLVGHAVAFPEIVSTFQLSAQDPRFHCVTRCCLSEKDMFDTEIGTMTPTFA